MTAEITLRDVTESDWPIFFEQQLESEGSQMAGFPSRPHDAYMAHMTRTRADPSNVQQAIIYNGQVAGNIVSWEQDGEREVGYWLGKEYWGKGIATAALAAFLQQETTRPLYAYIVKHNIGSRRVLEKCGFAVVREEGEEFILMLGS